MCIFNRIECVDIVTIKLNQNILIHFAAFGDDVMVMVMVMMIESEDSQMNENCLIAMHNFGIFFIFLSYFGFFKKRNYIEFLPVLPIWLCVRHLFYEKMARALHENHLMDLGHLLALDLNK